MAMQGLSRGQIAETLKEDVAMINRIWDTPQVQDLFRREIAARGKFAIKTLLAGAATDAVCAMIEILNAPGADSNAIQFNKLRLNAANAILDRAYGRPTQTTKMHGDDLGEGDPATELAKIQQQISAIQSKKKTLP